LTRAQVVHITSKTLEEASSLLRVALQAGFRNSGLVVSSSGRITIGIRASPSALNVPIALACDQADTLAVRLLVEPSYLSFLISAANKAMSDNLKKIERLRADVQRHFQVLQRQWEDPASRMQRKRQEGLARQAALASNSTQMSSDDSTEET
jgi:tRNA wybutosine-synthesizing protein 3